MNRKLWALNFALAAVATYAGFVLQREWAAKRTRQETAVRIKFKATKPEPFTPQPVPPPVLPTTYSDVAQKLLLDPSRNPDVIIPPVAPPPPPPPVQEPPLPGFHGEMNLDGPAALLSTGTGKPEAIHPGEMIGPFKLVDVNRTDITFEWNGQLIKKLVDEILVKQAAPEVASNGNAASPPMAAAAPPQAAKPLGPGAVNQFGVKPCLPGDSLPDGTVQDGFRKTSHPTPFGNACTWDPVGGLPSK